MNITLEMSMYPLDDDYKPPIRRSFACSAAMTALSW